MYVEIKDNKLISWCRDEYLDYEYVAIDYENFDPEKYEVINGVLTDVSQTDAYKLKLEEKEKLEKKLQLNIEMENLDQKRIRALAEPELKDASSGQTWLEYYTAQIREIRSQLASL